MFSFKKKDMPKMECEMNDGRVIHILPASKAILEKMTGFSKDNVNIDELYGLVADILSENSENVKYTAKDIDWMDFSSLQEFVMQYQLFMVNEVAHRPN